jgi:hypothetical protein
MHSACTAGGLSGSTIFFHIVSRKVQIPEKKCNWMKLCVLVFNIQLSETFITVRRIKQDNVVIVHRYSTRLLSDFNEI